jgi:hypothetical protein
MVSDCALPFSAVIALLVSPVVSASNKAPPIGKRGQWGGGVASFTTPPLLSLGGKGQSTPKPGSGQGLSAED